MKQRTPHPLEHHPSFRAVIAAAPSIADLSRALPEDGRGLIGTLVMVCGDLAHGFAAPPGSRARSESHHRAWTLLREIDRAVTGARIQRLAPARVLNKAQRAIDRADVMLTALPGVLPG